MSIAAVIPTIPSRAGMLAEALRSVTEQTKPVDQISVIYDHYGYGHALTRDWAIRQAITEWVAPLDDDDWWSDTHCEELYRCAMDTGADLVYPGYEVFGGTDPFTWFGQPWDNNHPHQVPVTWLARRELVLDCGGFSHEEPADDGTYEVDELGHRIGADMRLILRMVDAGAKIVHLPRVTWTWVHHGANSSGLPSKVRLHSPDD
jgi:glycosyltransferase involved in cell wall biosynthesis